MKFSSLLFSGLVLLTACVSFRWGSIVGLIFFILTLITGKESRIPIPPVSLG